MTAFTHIYDVTTGLLIRPFSLRQQMNTQFARYSVVLSEFPVITHYATNDTCRSISFGSARSSTCQQPKIRFVAVGFVPSLFRSVQCVSKKMGDADSSIVGMTHEQTSRCVLLFPLPPDRQYDTGKQAGVYLCFLYRQIVSMTQANK
jgi:hypothetical protein